MANVPVNFALLKEKHPSFKTIRSLIKVPSYVDETCCVQVSYALNRSGQVIENYAYDNPYYKRKVRAFKANDGMHYIIEVSDFRFFLDNRYGLSENHTGSKQQMIEQIEGHTGILAFGYRHIDLWEGDRYHWQQLYLDLWGFASVKKHGIFFWEVTSEWGF